MLNENFLKYSSNPKAFVLKRWFAEFLQNKFTTHEQIIERVSLSLVTDKDLEDFGKLMTDLFEMGYFRAVNDYKAEFEKMGVQISVAGKV